MSDIIHSLHAPRSRSLHRGLRVLDALQDHPAGLNVAALCRETGLHRTTVCRLLDTLLSAGWVKSGLKKRTFVLAKQTAKQSGAGDPAMIDPRLDIALPAMRRLVESIKDAIFLTVLDGDDSLTLHREIGTYPIQILPSYPGQRHPAGVGSGGLAMLATLSDEQVDAVIRRNQSRLLQYSGMSVPLLKRLIENTRARGHAVMGNLAAHGAIGVACALTDGRGKPILAISVAAPVDRMPVQRHAEIAERIMTELSALKQHAPLLKTPIK